MIANRNASSWRVFGYSVQGASHKRTEIPNQDAILWLPTTDVGLPIMLAVADGHGSAKYFRSHIGARAAVESAGKVLTKWWQNQHRYSILLDLKKDPEKWLPEKLVQYWRTWVNTHLQENPFSQAEMEDLEAKAGLSGRQAVADNPFLAYGATILAVMVTATSTLFLQLGDGDILSFSESGKETRIFPKDDRLIANETTSLCQSEAWREFRVKLQENSEDSPVLFMLSTDGYANSFHDETDFFKVGADILGQLKTQGCQEVIKNIPTWLAETSRRGSGDDITLGIIYSQQKLNLTKEESLPEQALPAEEKPDKNIGESSIIAERAAEEVSIESPLTYPSIIVDN